MRDGQQVGLPRLLIVDDDPSIRFSMVAVLDEIGFSVRSADNGFSTLSPGYRPLRSQHAAQTGACRHAVPVARIQKADGIREGEKDDLCR